MNASATLYSCVHSPVERFSSSYTGSHGPGIAAIRSELHASLFFGASAPKEPTRMTNSRSIVISLECARMCTSRTMVKSTPNRREAGEAGLFFFPLANAEMFSLKGMGVQIGSASSSGRESCVHVRKSFWTQDHGFRCFCTATYRDRYVTLCNPLQSLL